MINKLQPFEEQIDHIIDLALAEDISHGDVTSEALIPSNSRGRHPYWLRQKGYWPAVR